MGTLIAKRLVAWFKAGKSSLRTLLKRGSEKGADKAGIKVTEEVATKTAEKTAVKAGEKDAAELSPKLIAEIGKETAKKTGGKLITWGAAKALAQKIPFISLVMGGAFAAGRVLKEDYVGGLDGIGLWGFCLYSYCWNGCVIGNGCCYFW